MTSIHSSCNLHSSSLSHCNYRGPSYILGCSINHNLLQQRVCCIESKSWIFILHYISAYTLILLCVGCAEQNMKRFFFLLLTFLEFNKLVVWKWQFKEAMATEKKIRVYIWGVEYNHGNVLIDKVFGCFMTLNWKGYSDKCLSDSGPIYEWNEKSKFHTILDFTFKKKNQINMLSHFIHNSSSF